MAAGGERLTPTADQQLNLVVSGRVGQLLQLSCPDFAIQVHSEIPLQAASQRPLDRDRLATQLGRLGGSGWCLGSLDVDLEDQLFLPVAELNRMRRDLLQGLEGATHHSDPATTESPASAPDRNGIIQALLPQPAEPLKTSPGLVVLARSLDQLKALIALPRRAVPIESVVVDLEQPGSSGRRWPLAVINGLAGSGWQVRGSRGRTNAGHSSH